MASLETLVITVDGDTSGAESALSALDKSAQRTSQATKDNFGRVAEAFDTVDTRAMGFRDTITGMQDTYAGWNALTTTTAEAAGRVADAQQVYLSAVKEYGLNSEQAVTAATELSKAQEAQANQQGTLGDKMLLLGTGVGDLASGMTNFLVPMALMATSMNALSLANARATASMVASKVATVAGTVAAGAATVAQWLWNVAMSANPIGLIILGIAALIAAIVWLVNNWDTVKKAGAAAWEWIKGAWDAAGDFFARLWNGVVGHVQNSWSRIKGALSGVGQWFSKIWDSAGQGARIVFNKVAGWWNNSIGRVGFTIPSWVPEVGGRSFSVPKIPYLADGGIATGPTLAMIGEGRHDEAVIPLPKGMRQGLGGGGATELTLRFEGDEDMIRLFRKAVRDRGGNVQTVLGS